MKCPHCGIEVEPGTIFCPKCLTEIPWVPEYNTIETLMTKQKSKKELDQTEKPKKTHTKRQNRIVAGVVAVVVCILVLLIIKFTLDYRNYNSFDYQYDHAMAAYDAQDYEKASKYIDRALELDADSLDGNILYAKVLQAEDDAETAIGLLQTLIAENPDLVSLYGALIQVYEQEGRMEDIHKLMSECRNKDILEEFSDYVASDPTTSIETGVYDEELSVELLCTNGMIYYTTDGSDPTQKSEVYQAPIPMKEGVTVLKAICVNDKGISSDIIYRKYTIVIKGPDAPVVTPSDGEYTEQTYITMEIPDGCKGYYAFDTPQVSTASQEYTGPVEMPEGTHVFYGILVAANGKESDPVSKSYTLTRTDLPSSGES
ncbi:MAG: chitobiase/beta-hexosaminidase C-terminal domain-containing protein [Blautia sp.]|jgi:hypothetical protein